MSTLELREVSKRFGEIVAVEPTSLAVPEGEFVTLLGPSGCGKTTTLRMVAGFIDPSAGEILAGGRDITRLPTQKRNMGMVFQDYSLFPHLSVADNIAFGLVERRWSRERCAARVEELLALIRLPEIAPRYPAELSGGQQQRVALARALAIPPAVLLMDEPFGALDLKLREAMQAELRQIQRQLRITTIFVTHDQTEALSMSDRIAVMNAGRIEQLDTPGALYRTPRTRFVAGFLGKINFLEGVVEAVTGEQVQVRVDGQDACALVVPVHNRRGARAGDRVTLAIRPEEVRVLEPGHDTRGMFAVRATVGPRVYLGNLAHAEASIGEQHRLLIEARPGQLEAAADGPITVGWSVDAVTLLPG